MITTTDSKFACLIREEEVHRSIYTDPDIFEEEMRRIFARTWVFIGHESEVPNPGDFKTGEIARQPIVMTRHTDGRVYVMFNTCRHRGALVCLQEYGNSMQLRCVYHGWTWKPNGELVGVPFRDGFSETFDPSQYGLLPLPRVASYRGFVFASLNENVPDLDEYLGRVRCYLDLMLDRAPERQIEVIKPLKYEFRGNWKLQLENFVDLYHPPFLHRSAFDVATQVMPEKYGKVEFRPLRKGIIERSFKYGHGVVDYNGTRAAWEACFSDPEYLQLLEARDGTERAHQLAEADMQVVIFPNLLLHIRLNHYRVIKPVAVDNTIIHVYPCKLKGAPTRINEMLVRYTSEHVSAGGEIQVDDVRAFELVQAGLRSQAVEWLPFKLRGEHEGPNQYGEMECYSVSEMIQRGYYREWVRLMAQS